MARPRRKQTPSARTLRSVLLGTAPAEGDAFLRSLVSHLGQALGVRYAFVTECVEGAEARVRTLAFCDDGRVRSGQEWSLAGTPCEEVVSRNRCCWHESGVQDLFPADEILQTWRAESYMGLPLVASSGRMLGHLAVFDVKPLRDVRQCLAIMNLFAVRAAAELERRWLAAERARILERLRASADSPALRRMLPACAWCRRIRDDSTGAWMDTESYLTEKCDTTFTHGICPTCREQVAAS